MGSTANPAKRSWDIERIAPAQPWERPRLSRPFCFSESDVGRAPNSRRDRAPERDAATQALANTERAASTTSTSIRTAAARNGSGG